MRRSNTRGLMALENENLENQEGGEELGAAPESLETDLLDVNDEEVAAGDDEAQTEEAAEVVEALEQAALALESAVQNGGLNADGAHILDLHVSHLYRTVGMQRQAVPSLESFGSTSGRQRATQIALEDIKDSIKKIWEKIINAIKSAIAWVKDRFTKIFGAADKLARRAKALAERSAATSGTAKEKTIENERLVKALHVGGAVPTGLGQTAQDLTKLANGIFGGVTNWNGEVADSIVELLDNPKAVADFTLKSLPNGSIAGLKKAGADFGDAGNGMVFMVGNELPGGQAIVGRVPNSATMKGPEAIEALTRTVFSVGAHNPKAKDPSKAQAPVLAPSEAERVAEAVQTLAEEVQSYKRSLDKLAATKEKIVAAAGKAAKASDNSSDDEGDRTNNKLLSKLGFAVPKLVDQPATGFAAYALNTGKALLDYVELSLKQYEGK